MLILYGGEAETAYRRSQRLQALQTLSPQIRSVGSHWVYFVDFEGSNTGIDSDTKQRLCDLLSAFSVQDDNQIAGKEVIVSPRIGTISPWSSKATDIAHNCGLSEIARIERAVSYRIEGLENLSEESSQAVVNSLFDRMTEQVLVDDKSAHLLFDHHEPAPVTVLDNNIPLKQSLEQSNSDLGLALSDDEIEYLIERYTELQRMPTDAELMMFAQANSEHCRHKIFNASWSIDGEAQDRSLFQWIKNTYEHSSEDY